MNKYLLIGVIAVCIGAFLIVGNWFVDFIWLHRMGHIALLIGLFFLSRVANSASNK